MRKPPRPYIYIYYHTVHTIPRYINNNNNGLSVLLMRNYRAERFPGFGTFYDLDGGEKEKSNNRAEVDLENNRVQRTRSGRIYILTIRHIIITV